MLKNQNQGGAGDRVPSPNRELLEQTKLSRLPSLPKRQPFRLPDFDNTPTKSVAVVAVCAGCNTRLDIDDPIQLRLCGCRKCIGVFGRMSVAIEENEKRERQTLLEKFIGGAK
jgi:hypothetical protein